MKLYAAPMEGITGYTYRNAHHHYFEGINKYFTPFLTPKKGKGWTSREKNDVMPAHNEGIPLVPQILTNRSEDFVRMAEQLQECGYEEVNLYLGCPSGTVVSKGKGCAFLADREKLLRFFDEVFAKVSVKVSVKTRLGVEDSGEIVPLMDVYNQFPLSEVIIHARIHKDYYKKPVNWDAFRKGFLKCRHSVCYNGDIFTKEDFEEFHDHFPEVDRIMLGRGLITDPQLAERIAFDTKSDKIRWKSFHDELCHSYEGIMSGERNVLFKMKELWGYMIPMFQEGEKYGKKIRKSRNLGEYKQIIEELFQEKDLINFDK
ncbi:MAG: tRNA-dihydrouridine synthase family protein [Clostridiales bacterium]|nr:tRNA-dihydrouridine synthase family protein [Clostridiales bacterium]